MRILIISYGFPPRRHVSGQRAFYVSQELSRRGHQVVVLTQDWRYPLPDQLPKPDSCAAQLREPWDDQAKVLAADPRWVDPGYLGEEKPEKTRTEKKPVRKLLKLPQTFRYGSMPLWYQAAIRLIPSIYSEWAPDLIWAISGGNSPHYLAAKLNFRLGTPWIADFKDPWNIGNRGFPWSLLYRALRKNRLKSASCLTETSRAQALLDVELFQKEAHVIYSGYNSNLMEKAKPQTLEKIFSILYTGTPNINQSWDLFCKGFDRFVRNHALDPSKVAFLYQGTGELAVRDRFRANNLEQYLRVAGYQSIEDSFGWQKGTDLLLHLSHSRPQDGMFWVSMKFFEYLASGTPLLVIPAEIEECRAIGLEFPQYAEASTIDQVESRISEIFLKWKTGEAVRHPHNSQAVVKYTSARQVSHLEEVMINVLEGKNE